jgi:hypothetical protein
MARSNMPADSMLRQTSMARRTSRLKIAGSPSALHRSTDGQ